MFSRISVTIAQLLGGVSLSGQITTVGKGELVIGSDALSIVV